MTKKVRDLVLGANRGPLLTNEPSTGVDLEKTESAGGMSLTSKPTGKEKFRRHWKRFWFVYFVGNIIFLAIILPIFFLVVLPAIAQLVVNKSNIYIVSASVKQPKPDSVIMSLQSKVDLHLLLAARIEPLEFHLFDRKPGFGSDYPYANLPIPGATIKGNYSLGVNDVYTPILNMTSWDEFVREIVFNEKTTFSLKGVTNAYLGILKSHVHLNKDVVAPSLNKFNGFTITDTTLLIPPKPDGINLLGNVTLPNPTVLSFEVGTLQLDVMSGDLIIGNATLSDVALSPGSNTYALTGTLDLKKVIQNLGQVIRTQLPALLNGDLSLSARTTSVVWNGTQVPYYTDVLRTLTLNTKAPIGPILKNTIHYFGTHTNLNLSRLIPGPGPPGHKARSLDGREPNFMNELATVLKQNQYMQDIFDGVAPADRDEMIDTLLTYYPQS